MPLLQIKASQIATYRAAIGAKQGHRCALCNERLALGRPTLDHDHKNGRLRGVLCNFCNIAEGLMMESVRRRVPADHMVKTDTKAWLQLLVDYLNKYDEKPTNIVHPTFDLAKGKQKPKKRVVRKKKKA